MENIYKIKNQLGIPFNVKLVFKDESYGKDKCLIHDKDEPMVEFYDSRFDHEPEGLFISRYNISAFSEIKTGINLDVNSYKWSIDYEYVAQIQGFIREAIEKKEKIHNCNPTIYLCEDCEVSCARLYMDQVLGDFLGEPEDNIPIACEACGAKAE